MKNKITKASLFTLVVAIGFTQPIFASNETKAEVLSNITTKADTLDEIVTTTTTGNTNSSSKTMPSNMFNDKTTTTNVKLPTSENSATTLNIEVVTSNYLIERQNELSKFKENFPNLAIVNGNEENEVYIYTNADETSKMLGKTKMNVLCEVNDSMEDWYFVKANDIEGYVKADEILITDDIYTNFYNKTLEYAQNVVAPLDNETVAISSDNNSTITLDATMKYKIVSQDDENIIISVDGNNYTTNKTNVSVIADTSNAFALFSDHSEDIYESFEYGQFEKIYYIKTSYVSSKEPMVMTETEMNDLRNEIVDFALQYVGNPYVWGGTSLTKGTDCSGFMLSIYKNFGINLTRVASSQSRNGTKISPKDVQPGDLVFYGSPSITHVAMYIGDGKIVHASNPSDGIKISSMYYNTPCTAASIISGSN